jgi:serine phosphatase RsbU (regulator of sigma subunit)/pSer/pThr/pTyr-binding forkhead associated (FHA) protein
MPILQVIQGPEPGRQLQFDGERTILGRHPECDVVLDAAAVSRQHARIIRESGQYFLEDLGSRNGTLLNGAPITGRRLLHDGDQLVICDLSFQFYGTPPSDMLAGPPLSDDSVQLFIDESDKSNSTIMSKVDVSSSWSSRALAVRPEAKLKAMFEIAHNLSRTLSLDEVLPKLLDSLFTIFVQADRGFVVLASSPSGPLIPKAIKLRRPDDDTAVRISRTIVRQAIDGKEAVLSADAASDSRFNMSESITDFHIRSLMCAPLLDAEGNPLGVIQIDTLDQRSRFTEEDLEVLASIASQAAIAIDNAQLHERALQQQVLERDILLARQVQMGLLPSRPPEAKGYHFFHYYEPARQVGGDYFDYIPLPGGKIAVVLGDVSGKGVSAALLMAKLSGEVRYSLASESDPALAVRRINETFSRDEWADRFVTFIVAIVHLKTHEVTLVNAGHMAPILRSASGEVSLVADDLSGVPLGVQSDYPYVASQLTLGPGESLTIYTDGFSEAMNADNELYGLSNLVRQVGQEALDVEEVGQHIVDDVRRFAGGHPQSDDMCLVCFGRVGE